MSATAAWILRVSGLLAPNQEPELMYKMVDLLTTDVEELKRFVRDSRPSERAERLEPALEEQGYGELLTKGARLDVLLA